MTKKDLKYGNVVELRNGLRFLYQAIRDKKSSKDFINLSNGRIWFSLDDIDDNLKSYRCLSDRCDIMKVYKDYTLKELLWERKEKPKLTYDEKAILRNIDKQYKYIKRDKDGELFVYQDFCMTYIPVFNHLFKFIDKEPCLIEDLLKGE